VVDLVAAAAAAATDPRSRQAAFEAPFAEAFQARTALAVSSGKAALTLLLQALAELTGRTRVIIPAYTCYSVPSAIVKAGLDVAPCDLARDSFDYDHAQLESMLDSSVLCVLSVHLFGLPSDTARLGLMCRGSGIFVVEDVAQGLGGLSRDGRPFGTIGDAAIFSFGRGKNVTCGSGGVVVTGSDQIAQALDRVAATVAPAGPSQAISTGATLLILSWFIRPGLYWFPAGLPFLRLGETVFHQDFPVRWLSDFQARLLVPWQERLGGLDDVRRAHAGYYASHLDCLAHLGRQPALEAGDAPLLRFPVLLEGSAQRERVIVEYRGQALGITGMYPATVASIPQLAGRLGDAHFPEAESVAARLVTLPTHPLVSDRDRGRICALLNECVLGGQVARMAS
jgi:dTDP-4-amino-4,6-dideoxygalactose transaminase